MTPEEIRTHFGEDGLNMLYECVLSHPAKALANWIFSFHTEQQIAEWVMQLKQDELED